MLSVERFRHLSLKTKMTCMASLLVIVLLSLLASFTHDYFSRTLRKSIGDRQFTLVSALANEIDSKIVIMQNTVSVLASELKPEQVSDHAGAQQFLRNRIASKLLFDNGIFIFDRSGKMIAGTNVDPDMWQRDYSGRSYFRNPLLTHKSFISEPFISVQQHRHPIVMVSAPVLGYDGEVIAILSGSIDLLKENFLGKLSTLKLGQGGYLYLYTTDRAIVMHPDRSRILSGDVPVGVNRLFDKAIGGFEGTGETITSRGVKTLASFKRLQTTNWILAANYPTAEAFAPVYQARQFILVALAIMVLFAVVLIWLFMRHLTAPLLQFTGHVSSLTNQSGRLLPITVGTRDEIGTLAQAFNLMLAQLEQQKSAIHAQKEFAENLVQNSARPTFVLDNRHNVLIWNSACEELTGTRGTEVIGTRLHWSAFYDHERPCLADIIIDGAMDELPRNYSKYSRSSMIADGLQAEGWFPSLNGMERYMLFSAAPIHDSQGNLIAVIENLEDITEHKRTEDEIKQMLSLLKATLESTADGILVIDTQRRIVSYNKRFTDMWRIPEDLLATGDDHLLQKYVLDQLRNPEEFAARINEIHKQQDAESYDILEFADGRCFERTTKPQTVDDKIIGKVLSFHDITEQRKLANQLRHSQKMEAIGTLTGGIAHDFNNIITALIGYGNLIDMQLEEASPLRHFVEQMLGAAEKAAGLTKGLLTYSRKQPLNPCPMDLNEIIRRVTKLLSRLISENIEFSTTLADGSLTVLADSGQMEQVIMNLVTNARDAMPNGGTLTISTDIATLGESFIKMYGYGEPGPYARISVTDTGNGMSKELLERIFEPFFTTKEVGSGTGLGLSIVYGIVKQHQGYIIADSEPGKGTLFQIYLPLAPVAKSEVEVENSTAGSGGSETILVIEDNAEVRQLLRALLEEYGYRVIEAVDGEDACCKFREHRDQIHLLVLDVIMPKKNGKEVYDELRQLQPGIKALFTSGYSEDIISRNGILKKDLNYMSKPLVPHIFLEKVREVLET